MRTLSLGYFFGLLNTQKEKNVANFDLCNGCIPKETLKLIWPHKENYNSIFKDGKDKMNMDFIVFRHEKDRGFGNDVHINYRKLMVLGWLYCYCSDE